jgi:hypothetical protein
MMMVLDSATSMESVCGAMALQAFIFGSPFIPGVISQRKQVKTRRLRSEKYFEDTETR